MIERRALAGSARVREYRLAGAALCVYVGLLFAPNLTLIARDPGVIPVVRGIVVTGLLVAALFSVFRRRLWIACLLLAPFAIFAPAEAYYIGRYGHPSDANIVATVFESNLREASGYLGPSLAALSASIVLAGLLSCATVLLAWKAKLAWTHRLADWVLAVAIGVPLATLSMALFARTGEYAATDRVSYAAKKLARETYATYPFGAIWRFVEYRTEWTAMREAAQRTRDFRFGATRKAVLPGRQIYVLVIGEASRRDHWSLFGYQRDTNPELARTPNVVSIDNMISPWGASRWAVPMIVTRKPENDWEPFFAEPSVSRLFQEAGFDTYWYSTQFAVGEFDSPISVAAFDAQHVEFFNPAGLLDDSVHDDALIAPLRKAIGESTKDLFIVLHTMGSHQPYPARYPATFARFKPAAQDADANDPSLIENAYDNSILFTDHFLASVIDVLARTDSIATLFYVSDHGEMLPNRECRASGHGFSGLPVYEVPALFWYSTAYLREFPDKVAALEVHRRSPVSTSNVFQSIADMANIGFAGRDATRSLFNADWQPHRRLVHADATVDFDRKAVVSACEVVVPERSPRTTLEGSSSGDQGAALPQPKQAL